VEALNALSHELERTRRDEAWAHFLGWATEGKGVGRAALGAARREIEDE
jgi:hypothetical protein